MIARLALLALLFADPSAEPEEVVKDRKAFLPWRHHGPLKGKVIGVLASDVSAFMGREGRAGPPEAMAFGVGRDSYRWVYVAVAEKPLITDLSVEVGEKAGGKTRTYPKLDVASAKLVKRWDIDVPYALVEAEVNDAEGAPPGEGFVATKMTRLDGGKRFALDVTKAVEEAKKRHAGELKAKAGAVAAALAAQEKALKGKTFTGPRDVRTVMHATWLVEGQRLRVAFRTTVADGAFTFVDRRGLKVKAGTRVEVDLGWAYEFDREGKVARAQALPPEAKAEEVSPP